MSKNRKGPKQQDQPNLPLSPEQPYGEPLSGSHQEKKQKPFSPKEKRLT